MSGVHLPDRSQRAANSVMRRFGKPADITPKADGADAFNCLLIIRAPVDIVDENPAGFSLQGAALTARGLWSDVSGLKEGDGIMAQGEAYTVATVPRDNGFGLGDFDLALAPV